MHKIINDILETTKKRLTPLDKIKKGKLACRDFQESIKYCKQENLVPLVAEVKPSSPTRFIRDVTPEDAALIAGQMEAAGAAAISVLTEPHYCKGSIRNLNAVRSIVGMPVLRKNFSIG